MPKWLSGLFGGKSQPARGKAAAAAPKAAVPMRAQLIKEALALHEAHGATLRAALHADLKRLENPRTLRDAAELQRLLALAQARKTMARLLGGDLRRYLVLAGLRQWSGHEPVSPAVAAPAKKVARR
jgi:hypothetical protein